LAHIAHILVLSSHYLAIRLPAEITLPHRDYPRSTIFNLSSSYQHGTTSFPGALSMGFGPDNRDRETQHTSRPRPLFVEKSLPILAKEDPVAHSFFLEGVTLLAYDIAWLCCTQGISIGDRNTFEDICNMGRNLYSLLIGNQLYNNQSGKAFPALSAASRSSNNVGHDGAPRSLAWLGRFSHGTAHSFLGSAEGMEFMRGFKLPSPLKLADKLKKKLVYENIPEWELLGDDDWAQDENNSDKRQDPGAGDKANIGEGTSGWTKLKMR
jgi:hypothetical protein